MRRLLVLAIVAVVARASANSPITPLVLTAMDSEPTEQQLDSWFGSGSAMNNLTAIAENSNSTWPTGIRLRAIHALADYCTAPCADSDPAHVALVQLVTVTPAPESGSDLLILRAAIESIGLMRDPNDEPLIVDFLNHASRDVRATTAFALASTCACVCNTAANQPLRTRLQVETVDQVKLAISSALRTLGSCPVSPP